MNAPKFCIALTLACTAILTGAPAHGFAPNQSASETAPPDDLDPLTDEEKVEAERLVRADPRAAKLLGERAKLVSIEFLAIKNRTVRHADLLFAIPEMAFGARAIVQLGASPSIVEFTRIDARSVPMTQADVEEAWNVARADKAYMRGLGRSPERLTPEALRIYTEDRSDPCYHGRCFYLILRDGDYYVSNASVVVDLATKRILLDRSAK